MMRILLLAFTFTFLFSGCSQQKQKTPLKVSIGAAAGSSVWTGGLIIYGSNNFGKKFVKELAANDELLIELPNGIWKFGAIGWVGSAKLEGTAHCDYKSNINLQGEQIDLTMVASVSKCDNPVFGGNHDGTSGFTQLEFNSCSGIKNAIAAGQASEYSSSFVCDGDDNPFAGDSKSYKLVIPQNVFDAAGMIKPDGQTISKCYGNDGTTNTAKILSLIRVPAGTLQNSIPYSVIAYTGTNCTGNSKLYLFINGLTQTAQFDQGFGAIETSPLSTRVFLHTDVCSAEQKIKLPFAVSSFGTNEKHLICTADQLKNVACTSCPGVGSDPASNANYILAADIDLTGISADAGEKAYIKNVFRGRFDGQGHIISNGTYPLFDEIKSPESANDETLIRNINLSNFDINISSPAAADSNIGIFAKAVWSSGKSEVKIKNNKIFSNSSLVLGTRSGGSWGGFIGAVVHDPSGNYCGGSDPTVATDCGPYLTEKIIISGNEQLANVTTQQSGDSAYTGGFIGQARTEDWFFDNRTNTGITDPHIIIENNAVGKSFSNLGSFNDTITINSKTAAGGLIGFARKVVVENNFISTKIINHVEIDYPSDSIKPSGTNVPRFGIGGVIGILDHFKMDLEDVSTHIKNNDIKLEFIPFNSGPYPVNVGGIIGLSSSEGEININSNIARLNIPSTSTEINNVGGFIGHHDVTYEIHTGGSDVDYPSKLKITNSKAIVDITSDGENYGGFIGHYASLYAATDAYIDRSIVTGHIKEYSSNHINTLRSGMIGYAKNAKVTMSVSEMDIEAYDIAGGFAAESYKSTFYNNYGDFQIDISKPDSDLTNEVFVGGAIGKLSEFPSSSTVLEESLISSNIKLKNDDATTVCNGNLGASQKVHCGLIVGSIDATLPSFTHIYGNIAAGKIENSNTSPDDLTENCGSHLTNACNILTLYDGGVGSLIFDGIYDNQSDDTCDDGAGNGLIPMALEFNWDSTDSLCEPTFYYQWKKYGLTDSGDLLAGNALEPLEIGTVAEWNAIEDDEFLMNKSFMLTADLDFNSGTFNPIGYYVSGPTVNVSVFSGDFIPNGYRLKNITHTFNKAELYNSGVFAYTQNARIGDYNDPLVIDGFTASFNNSGVTANQVGSGVIGKAEDSDLFIQVKSAQISDNLGGVPKGIGGIVGLAVGDVSINNSSFEGAINADNTADVGGLVAQVDSSSSLKIQSSYVDLSSFKGSGSSTGGGFVGIVPSGAELHVNTSYLKFSLSVTTDFDVDNFGGVVGDNTGSASIENSFVDFSNLDNFHTNKEVGSSTLTVTNTGFGAVGSFNEAGLSSSIVGTTFDKPSQYDLHTANPEIFSIGGGEDWKLDNCNNLRLFWEYIDPNQICPQPPGS